MSQAEGRPAGLPDPHPQLPQMLLHLLVLVRPQLQPRGCPAPQAAALP